MSAIRMSGRAYSKPKVPRTKEEKRRIREELKRDFFTTALYNNKYRVEKIIGEGAYGVVCEAIDLQTNERVAVKRVRHVLESRAKAVRALREIKFLRVLSAHQNIITVKDILVPGERDRFNDIYIVFELMPADLRRLLCSKTILSDDHIRFMMFQLLQAVRFLHSARVFHRDLNPKNILIDNNCQLRVCDFGLARASFHSTDDMLFWTDYVATRWYRAPELILAHSTKYSTALDMWSIGCIFAEMLSRGRPLFPGRSAREQFGLITRVTGRPSNDVIEHLNPPQAREYLRNLPARPILPLSEIFPQADPAALQLLGRLLEFDADKRITALEALASPYFAMFGRIPIGEETGPLDPKEFAFELGGLSWEQMRLEFLREIAHYHPEMSHELLAPRPGNRVGMGATASMAPSPAEQFGMDMKNVDKSIPMKDRSLPQKYYAYANPQEAVKPDTQEFKSSTFGEAEMIDLEGSEALKEQRESEMKSMGTGW